MKRNEFEKELNVLCFEYVAGKDRSYIKYNDEIVSVVNETVPFKMTTNYRGFDDLRDSLKASLLECVFDYATTPLKQREFDEKFYWKLKGKKNITGHQYFNLSDVSDGWLIFAKEGMFATVNKFTKEEFKELEDRFGIHGMFVEEEIE